MKKWIKAWLIFLLPVVINHLIFRDTRRRMEGAQERYFKSRFGRIRYTVCGKGEPLLLLHGIGPGRSLEEWEAFTPLVSAHYKVYALDLPGFGRSDTPALTYSAYLYVSLVNAFIRKVIKKKTMVIAEGRSAAYAVAACAVAPEYFSKLLTVAPEGVTGREEPTQPARRRMAFRRIIGWLAATPLLGTSVYNLFTSRVMMRMYLNGLTYRRLPRADHERHYLMAHTGGRHGRFIMSALLAGDLDADIRHILPKIKIPIRVVWGQYNRTNPASRVTDVHKLNPDITAAVIKNTGGLPYWENPNAFHIACAAFLKG